MGNAEVINFLEQNKIEYKIELDGISIQLDTTEFHKWRWDTIKQKLDKKNISLLKKIVIFREHFVKLILKELFIKYGCNDEKKKIYCSRQDTGSTGKEANLKSDYDITISRSDYTASRMIRIFNDVVKKIFGLSSYEVFDTNLYGYSALLPNNPLFLIKETWKVDPFNRRYYYLPLEEKNYDQDRWALRRMNVFLKLARPDFLKRVNISLRFPDSENCDSELIDILQQNNYSRQSELYKEKMEFFESIMAQFRDPNIPKNRETGEEIKINDVRNNMAEALSGMNYYGDETYFTIGSFMHVVGTMLFFKKEQSYKKSNFLLRCQLIHSMIENMAYFISSLNENHKNTEQEFIETESIIIAIKYLERFMNAYFLIMQKNGKFFPESQKILELLGELKNKFRNATVEDMLYYIIKSKISSKEYPVLFQIKLGNKNTDGMFGEMVGEIERELNMIKNKKVRQLFYYIRNLSNTPPNPNDNMKLSVFIDYCMKLFCDLLENEYEYTYIRFSRNGQNIELSMD